MDICPEITVSVSPRYLPEHSNPEASEYTFAYTVSIHNESTESVQLISRHWLITDENNSTREVIGDGVVGKQPHIAPGEIFQYSSGAILNTPTGTMEGSYQMVTESGQGFETKIAPFGLIHPKSLH